MKKTIFSALIAITAVFVLSSPQVWAAPLVLVVDRIDDPDPTTANGCDDATPNDCSLRGAILKANATLGSEQITLPAGTYTLTRSGGCEEADSTGDLDITGITTGDGLTIKGAGAATTIVDAGDLDRVFDVHPPFLTSVVINDLTIRNGTSMDNCEGCIPCGDGGGVRVGTGSPVTLNRVVVSGNNADEGGGVYNDGTLTVTDSTINNNQAFAEGGGVGNTNVCSPSNVTITGSTISNNVAGDVSGSSEGNGGGIFTGDGTVRVVDSTVSGNRAVGTDVAGNGGGIFVSSFLCQASVVLMNATVTNNTADNNSNGIGDGGGIAVQGHQLPPALTVALVLTTDELNIRNTILAGNIDASSSGTLTPDCAILSGFEPVTFNSEGFNLIGDETGCDGLFGGTGDQVGTSGSPKNPRLGPLADNGGPTLTHALLTSPVVSPAIDTANPAGCFTDDANSAAALTQDQRGSDRPLDGGPAGPSPARCDIGAFELGGCGDGFKDPSEQCDDGNKVGGDGCSATCQIEACGNGTVDVGEVCDDGNTTNGDGCSDTCQLESCGDGVKQPSEGCDDGNTTDGDGCDSNCTPTACGNRILTSPEACDDGNTVDADGCEADCTLPACGNGVVDPSEECDDNNTTDGDGCSSTCTVESSTDLLTGGIGCSLTPSQKASSQGFVGWTGIGLLAVAAALLIRKRILG